MPWTASYTVGFSHCLHTDMRCVSSCNSNVMLEQQPETRITYDNGQYQQSFLRLCMLRLLCLLCPLCLSVSVELISSQHTEELQLAKTLAAAYDVVC